MSPNYSPATTGPLTIPLPGSLLGYDICQVVEFPYPGSRPVPVLDGDLNDTLDRAFERGSFAVVPGQRQAVLSPRGGTRRGARQVSRRDENASLNARVMVKDRDGDPTSTIYEIRDFLALVDELTSDGDRFIMWRPDGAEQVVYLEVLGDATWTPQYQRVQVTQGASIVVEIQIPVAPAARLDAFDIEDRFEALDNLTDYVFSAGPDNLILDPGGEGMTAVVPATGATALHTARPWTHADVEVLLTFRSGATPTGEVHEVTLKQKANGDRLFARVSGAGGGTVTIHSLISGTPTQHASAAMTSAMQARTLYRLRAWIQGHFIIASLFPGQDYPGAVGISGTPTFHLDTQARRDALGAGVKGQQGYKFGPGDTSSKLVRFVARPYTYRLQESPDNLRLEGDIPGTLPALADITVECSELGVAHPFGLIGWWRRHSVPNMLWNGELEDDAHGWTRYDTGGLTGPQQTDTTFLVGEPESGVAKPPWRGQYYGRLANVDPNEGYRFGIAHRVKRGATYRARIRVRDERASPTPTSNIIVHLGSLGVDEAASASTAVTSAGLGWTEITVDWRPTVTTATRLEHFYLRLLNPAGSPIATWGIDGVAVWELDMADQTRAPTGRRGDGAGGHPAYGRIAGGGANRDRATGWTVKPVQQSGIWAFRDPIISDDTGTVGATFYRGEWLIDPQVVAGNDEHEITVEAWAVVSTDWSAVDPRVVTSLADERRTGGVVPPSVIYTHEYGAAGRSVAADLGADDLLRPIRLGTLTIPVDHDAQPRWTLRVDLTYGASSLTLTGAIENLILVPLNRRISSPSGKTTAAYPYFGPTTGNTPYRRVVQSDLRSALKVSRAIQQRSSAPGGAPIELGPGPVELVHWVSTHVPDSPDLIETSVERDRTVQIHVAVTPRVQLV
jgi:hypothetical protein